MRGYPQVPFWTLIALAKTDLLFPHSHKPRKNCIVELFCLQNSLIVGMQPHVSGKVGSLVGWFLGGPCSAFPMTVEFY